MIGLFLLTASAQAEPMDIADRTPRWVTIAFEVSPQQSPERLDSTYTPPLPAWLEPGELPSQIRIVVPAWVVERHLLPDQSPKPGTFSSFTWVFDADSREVLSAELSGVLVRRIRLGFLRTEVEADVQVAMSTLESAGFRPGARVLGQSYAKYCRPGARADCRLVQPHRYDPETGYVNAVGSLAVQSAMVGLASFSPLGEAIFRERAPRAAHARRHEADGSKLPPISAR